MSQFIRIFGFLAVVVVAVATPANAKRLAHVIGNDEYTYLPKLSRSVGDSKAMTSALEQLGFHVTSAQNLDFRAFTRTVVRFSALVAPGDEVALHYSGHGVSFGGRNYLLPVDLSEPAPAEAAEIAAFSIDAGQLVEMMRSRQPRFVFAVLDACRNPPFTEATRALAVERGLKRMDTRSGAFILFSAGEGEAALDTLGPGDNESTSVFTRVLLKHIAAPGMTLQKIAKATQSEVHALASSIGHQQFPDYSDRTMGEPILHSANAAVVLSPPNELGSTSTAQQHERAKRSAWRAIKAFDETYKKGGISLVKTSVNACYERVNVIKTEADLEYCFMLDYVSYMIDEAMAKRFQIPQDEYFQIMILVQRVESAAKFLNVTGEQMYQKLFAWKQALESAATEHASASATPSTELPERSTNPLALTQPGRITTPSPYVQPGGVPNRARQAN